MICLNFRGYFLFVENSNVSEQYLHIVAISATERIIYAEKPRKDSDISPYFAIRKRQADENPTNKHLNGIIKENILIEKLENPAQKIISKYFNSAE